MQGSMRSVRTWVGVLTITAMVAALFAIGPDAVGTEPGCDPKTEKCDPPPSECEKNPEHKRCQPDPGCEKDPTLPGCDDTTTTSSSSTTSSSTTSSSTTSSSTTSSSTTTTIPEVNEPPTLECPVLVLSARDPAGTIVGQAEAVDPEGDPITYSGGDADGHLAVHADGTIEIVTAIPIGAPSVVIDIVADDGTNQVSVECSFSTIAVTGSAFKRVYTSREAGHEVWVPSTETDEIGDWSIRSGNDDGYFAIDPTTGVVSVSADMPRPVLHALGTDREASFLLELEVGDPDEFVEVELNILTVDFFDDDHDASDDSISPYEDSINWMGDPTVQPWAISVTSGCTAPDKVAPVYCPEDGTLRGQMAVFVARMAMIVDESAAWDNNDPTLVTWDDTLGHRFSRWIMALRDAGVTNGCNSGTGFCPDRVITWGESAVFIMRAFGPDIDGSTGETATADEALAWLIDSGLTGDLMAGDQPTTGDRDADVLRGVMARVLHTVGERIGANTPG